MRLEHGGKDLVFGPYYARAAAFVPVTNDVVVVFGSDGAALEEPSDDALHAAAMLAADAVGSVTPAKQLADQLEELEAVRAASDCSEGDAVEETARALALVVAESLSCEVAAVYLAEPERLVIAERGWSLHSSAEEVRAALAVGSRARTLPLLRAGCGRRAAAGAARPRARRAVVLPARVDRHRARRALRRAHRCRAARVHAALPPARPAARRPASARLGYALTQEWCWTEARRLQTEFAELDCCALGANSFQCPSETTSTSPSTTLIAVSSSIAYAGFARPAAHRSASAMVFSGRSG